MRRNYKRTAPDVFLGKGVLKICSKFTAEHPCRSMICNFTEIAIWHRCSPANLLDIFRIPFSLRTTLEGCF